MAADNPRLHADHGLRPADCTVQRSRRRGPALQRRTLRQGGAGAQPRLRLAAPDPIAYDPEAHVSAAKQLTVDVRLPRQFWLYAAFAATTMLGFATWAVLAYHLAVKHVVSASQIALLYAAAMGAAALAALAFGRIYDRVGLRGLVVLPPLAA